LYDVKLIYLQNFIIVSLQRSVIGFEEVK